MTNRDAVAAFVGLALALLAAAIITYAVGPSHPVKPYGLEAVQ